MSAALLRRSLLFVPGAAPERITKAQGLSADGLILDLEDAVAVAEKEQARAHVVAALAQWPDAAAVPLNAVVVRVNAVDTPWHAADLAAVGAAGIGAIMLPKAECADTVAAVAEACAAHGVRLIPLIETARGVVNAAEIAGSHANIEALSFGHVDFARDMELDPGAADQRMILHARAQVVLAARAAARPALDQVCLAIRDAQIFRQDAEQGQALGYQGKLCIHPSQLATCNEVYSPTPEQIERAQRIVAAAKAAESQGLGVFSLDNKMIDAPVVAAQQAILARARLAGLINGEQT